MAQQPQKINATERVEIRVTPADKATIEANAVLKGVSVSEHLRESAMKSK